MAGATRTEAQLPGTGGQVVPPMVLTSSSMRLDARNSSEYVELIWAPRRGTAQGSSTYGGGDGKGGKGRRGGGGGG